jgi:N-acetyl-gamma-glutamyl-phosphate reductase
VVSVGIVGGTGYTGVELLRLLLRHPQVTVRVLTSRTEAGKRVADMFPSLRGHTDLEFSDLNLDLLKQCDVVFLLHRMVWRCNMQKNWWQPRLK